MPHERIVISAWRDAALPSKSRNTDIYICPYLYIDMEIWRYGDLHGLIYIGVHIYISVYGHVVIYVYIYVSVDRYPSM